MNIVSRSSWGARAPKSTSYTTWAQRTGFMIHYSAASADQTPRAIQDYHMNTNGWSDIGYNFLVSSKTGTIYEGRGWLVIGAHAANNNVANIGVCVIGNDVANRQDVSDAARSAINRLYEEANRRKGSKLAVRWHSQVNSTSCPGDELRAWIRNGMPVKSGTSAPSTYVAPTIKKLPLLKLNSEGYHVGLLQDLLTLHGFKLSSDDDFGPITENKVKDFQRTLKIDRDGIVGPITWGKLFNVR